MSEALTAGVSIEIDGTTYTGYYTINSAERLLTVNSEYGQESTATSVPSNTRSVLENNKAMAKLVLEGIVNKYLVRTRRK